MKKGKILLPRTVTSKVRVKKPTPSKAPQPAKKGKILLPRASTVKTPVDQPLIPLKAPTPPGPSKNLLPRALTRNIQVNQPKIQLKVPSPMKKSRIVLPRAAASRVFVNGPKIPSKTPPPRYSSFGETSPSPIDPTGPNQVPLNSTLLISFASSDSASLSTSATSSLPTFTSSLPTSPTSSLPTSPTSSLPTSLTFTDYNRGPPNSVTSEARLKALADFVDVGAIMNFSIPQASFQRLVREIAYDVSKSELRWQKNALHKLQQAVEVYLLNMFEISKTLASHRRKVTVTKEDLCLATVMEKLLRYK